MRLARVWPLALLCALTSYGARGAMAAMSTANSAQPRRELGKQRKKLRKAEDDYPEVCAATSKSSQIENCFDAVLDKDPRFAIDNEICRQYNGLDYTTMRESCLRNPICSFWGPAKSNRRRHQCIANPCTRINNGRCTIQHTGGRCVWWTQELNAKFRGISAPGCYESPCKHAIPNKAKACRAVNKLLPFEHQDKAGTPQEAALLEDSPFQCTWCHGGSRCVNVKTESQAQCWGLQDAGLTCTSSCASELGEPCPSTNCAKDCCDNDAWCKCASSHARLETTM